MIRIMEKRKPEQRVPKRVACPNCGAKCYCDGTRVIDNGDGTATRIQRRYCRTCKTDDGKRVGIKTTEMIEYD